VVERMCTRTAARSLERAARARVLAHARGVETLMLAAAVARSASAAVCSRAWTPTHLGVPNTSGTKFIRHSATRPAGTDFNR